MSNFNVLARLAPLGSLAPARCPPSLRQGFGGQATRRASETVGSNNPDKIGIKRKNAKFLKNFLNLNGTTGGLNKNCVLIVRLRH